MRTENQQQASRTNGAKSKGPTSEQGKANAAANSVNHNLTGHRIILLSTEDPEEYLAHIDDYMDCFQPIDPVERDLVNKLIAASWREKRIDLMEAALIELEINTQAPSIEKEFEIIDGVTRHTLAMLGANGTRDGIELLLRYQAAARRSYTNAFKILRELQGDRFNRKPAAPTVLPAGPAQSEAPKPPEPVSAPKPAAIAQVIPFRRRDVEETTKLPNEPRMAVAAGQYSRPSTSTTTGTSTE